MSHIEGPWELYVQERAQLQALKDLQRKVNKHCMESYCLLSEEELKEGEGCGGEVRGGGVGGVVKFKVTLMCFRSAVWSSIQSRWCVVSYFAGQCHEGPLLCHCTLHRLWKLRATPTYQVGHSPYWVVM